jgi:hypothetical protein
MSGNRDISAGIIKNSGPDLFRRGVQKGGVFVKSPTFVGFFSPFYDSLSAACGGCSLALRLRALILPKQEKDINNT